MPALEPSGNLAGRAALSPLEDDGMDSDKDKQLDDMPVEEGDADDGAIKDEGWSKVDLRDKKKTPEADTPSDIEP